jgi:hypothetical protein
MSEWMVRLTGDVIDLQNLAHEVNSSILSIINEEEGEANYYYLKSLGWNSLTDSEEVREKAEKLLRFINNLASVERKGFRTVSYDCIVKVEDKQTRRYHYYIRPKSIEVGRVYVGRPKLTVYDSEGNIVESPRLPSFIELALPIILNNSNVAKATRLWSDKDHDWGNLYKIWEVIRDDDKNGTSQWVTKAQFTRFTHTANSPHAVGDDARHGTTKQEPPKEPMTLDEGENFIRGLLHQWIRSKL